MRRKTDEALCAITRESLMSVVSSNAPVAAAIRDIGAGDNAKDAMSAR
jgi:hypothetical protein